MNHLSDLSWFKRFQFTSFGKNQDAETCAYLLLRRNDNTPNLFFASGSQVIAD